jgi:hypothetical protein
MNRFLAARIKMPAGSRRPPRLIRVAFWISPHSNFMNASIPISFAGLNWLVSPNNTWSRR